MVIENDILTAGAFYGKIESEMLTAEQLRAIDEAVRRVASAGWGLVSVVVEKGQAVRLQEQTDLRFEKRSTGSGSTSPHSEV